MTAPSSSSLPPLSNGGFVSNEVIALQIKHMGDSMDILRVQIVGELQMLRAESVRRDVYDQQRQNDKLALEQIKEELAEARQRKWAVWLAVGVAVFSLAKDLIGEVMKAGLT